MTGKHFKLIRTANKIRAIDLARELGYSSKSPIRLLENRAQIPYKVIKVLLGMIGIEFNEENKYREYLRHCAEVLTPESELENKDIRSTKWGALL